MPKSSTKSRSKRVQLKTKYKILKKVRPLPKQAARRRGEPRARAADAAAAAAAAAATEAQGGGGAAVIMHRP